MNRIVICLIPFLFFFSCKKELSKEQLSELRLAYRTHNYFKLDYLINHIDPKIENAEILLCRAKTGYVFNNPRESDSLINILLNKYTSKFNDTVIADLYYMRAVNEDRLENYKNSYDYGNIVVNKYSQLYDSSFIAELKDDNDVRSVLVNSPKMGITRAKDEKLKIFRDKAGLMNIPVVLGSDSMDFIFDTGANLSVIMYSVAKKYGFNLLGKKVKIMAITGKRIDADLALGDFKIGNIKIKNSVFIVFPDSILTFGKGAYVIKGIVGFPIISAFGELMFQKDKELIIPKVPSRCNKKNFALDDAMPVILVVYKNDSLPFHFDTGADRTFMYLSFFTKYKSEIVKRSKKVSQKIRGAGGAIDINTYILDSALLTAGNVQARVDSLTIMTKSLMSGQDKYYYGNFGQDFIRQYNVMKMNFASMCISFEK